MHSLVACTLWLGLAAGVKAQSSPKDLESLFAMVATLPAGSMEAFELADPVLRGLAQGSYETVAAAIPTIVRAASDPHVSVRREAAMAIYLLVARKDCRALIAEQQPSLSELLIDQDIPTRRVTAFAINVLKPDASSPLIPSLQAYLLRDDAVATIGSGVATTLMQAAPGDAARTRAVVQYMKRSDQTSESKTEILNSIRYVAKSHNPMVGKEVASYIADPDDETSVLAMETLQAMGRSVVLENQDVLSRVAADPKRSMVAHRTAIGVLAASK